MKNKIFCTVLIIILASSVLNAQNVGINTTTPQASLDVRGSQRVGGIGHYVKNDSTGRIDWYSSNLYVPVSQFLMKHSAAGDGLYYNNNAPISGQLEYLNQFGNPVFFTNFINGKGYFSGRLGISTINPLAGLHVKDSSVLFSADGDLPEIPELPPLEGPGRRMMWDPERAAFRVGYVDGDRWNQNYIGRYSFASGYNTIASGNYSTALGMNTNASGDNSTALGHYTSASGDYSTALGSTANAYGNNSFALGNNTSAVGDNSTSLGYYTIAYGENSIAQGYFAAASGYSSTALGYYTNASGDQSTALGNNTRAPGHNSTALGHYTGASGTNSTALGHYSVASGSNSTALGDFTNASGYSSTAMGHYSIAKAYISTAIGQSVQANAWASTVLGHHNDTIVAVSSFLIPTEPVLIVGNGTGPTNKKNALVILKNGKTGIGINNPSCPLSFPATLEKKISLYPGATGDVGFAVQGNQLQIYADNPAAMVRIGYDQSGVFTNNLDVYGNGNAWLRGTLAQNSDSRLKKEIYPLQNSLQKIILLNGYNYYWKNTNSDNGLQIGVIAQEVQKIFPQLVKEDKEGTLSVNYSGLIPVMIESIKEQQTQIDAQGLQIEELKKQVQKLLKQ